MTLRRDWVVCDDVAHVSLGIEHHANDFTLRTLCGKALRTVYLRSKRCDVAWVRRANELTGTRFCEECLTSLPPEENP